MTDKETQDDDVGGYIFVLPTEPGAPPRAMVGVPVMTAPDMMAMIGTQVTWSQDLGMWVDQSGRSVAPVLAKVITERCRELEVPGF